MFTRLAMGCLLGLVLLEATLQLAAFLVSDRADTTATGQRTVLCIGDSHTYGTGVTAAESYPGRLQAALDRAAPAAFHVVNRGLPGANASQTLARLPDLARQHDPVAVLVWVGVNDAWNLTDRASPTRWLALDGYLMRLRLYRTLRIWRHDRALNTAARVDRTDWAAPIERRDATVDAGTHRHLVTTLSEMAAWARGAGIPIAFVSYPFRRLSLYAAANRAIVEAAAAADVPVLDTHAALLRVPAGAGAPLWAAHPNAATYAEIGTDAAALVLRLVGRRKPDARPLGESATPH